LSWKNRLLAIGTMSPERQVETTRKLDRRDIEAEIAVGAGSAEILSDYFSEVALPSPFVLQALIWCLVGAGTRNQTLRFKLRNGRPLKKGETPPGDEAVAIRTFTLGDERALASYLDAGNVSNRVCQLLAEAFDSKGSTKQKLVFKRARAGNTATELQTVLERAHLGHTAEVLKELFGSNEDVYSELFKEKLLGPSADETIVKRAVSFVRQTMLENPQDYASMRGQVQNAFEALELGFTSEKSATVSPTKK
jgi:hypothetical protein